MKTVNGTTYDKVILLAKNSNNEVITACKWGKVWYFIYESKEQTENSGRIGETFNSENEILNSAYDYIINSCGYNFKECDLTDKVSKLVPVYLNNSQIVAINTAIMLLENSRSDHAEQALFHLNTIINQLTK